MASTQIDKLRYHYHKNMNRAVAAQIYHNAVNASRDLKYVRQETNHEPENIPLSNTIIDNYEPEKSSASLYGKVSKHNIARFTPDQLEELKLVVLKGIAYHSEKFQLHQKLDSIQIVTLHICAVNEILAGLKPDDQERKRYARRITFLSNVLHGLLLGPFGFLRLPIELRRMIYAYLFAPVRGRQVFPVDHTVLWQPYEIKKAQEADFWRNYDGNIVIRQARPANPAAILMTCKQINAEASPLFFAIANFTLTAMCHLPRSMYLNAFVLKNLRTVNVDWHGLHAAEVFSFLDRCQGLRHLQISVSRETVNGPKVGDLHALRKELLRATWKRRCLSEADGLNELCMMRGLISVHLVCDSHQMPIAERREFRSLQSFLQRTVTQPRESEGLKLILSNGEADKE